MMDFKRLFLSGISFFFVGCCLGLQADSLYYELPLVEVTSSGKEVQLRSANSEALLPVTSLQQQAPNVLLPAVNLIPGVRMEERSPGSYRFSIRGSLLRSPFGVRNVKFYLADWPLTDASGNTYLNILDISCMQQVRILKGPSSGLLGANTGGSVVLDPFKTSADSISAALSLNGGSFGFMNEHAAFWKQWKKASISLDQSYQRSDGYRDHSAMQRPYFQGSTKWHYRKDATIKAFLLLSDLQYQTPGGLTLQQVQENPRASRPATQTLPGAAEQQAGIFNKTIFSGVTHQRQWQEMFRHSVSIWGTYTDFQNPFITNYEHRKEGSFGARAYLEAFTSTKASWWLKGTVGGEWQQTCSSIENFGNNKGDKDTLQVSDRLRAQQAFIFTRLQADFWKQLLVEASLSLNFFELRYRGKYPLLDEDWKKRSFTPQWMPRLTLSYTPIPFFSMRGILSKGFSVPTLSEIRASDNRVNTRLEAEKGINYEVGVRVRDGRDFFWLDAAFFWYQLKDAIVRQVNEQGEESFVNAGSTRQPGIEIFVQANLIKDRLSGWLRKLALQGSFAWNDFKFASYRVGSYDFSGNRLTGTPKYVTGESVDVRFAAGFGLYVQHYFASSLPLNDANTVMDDAYHILQANLSWGKDFAKWQLQLSVGVDNLLNQQYSLGNDLNAFGGRFYNPAPTRNYYAGLKVGWGR